jgi:hypothetical protein
MNAGELITNFMVKVKEDPRIGPMHISLYTALLSLWLQRNCIHPLSVFSHDVMPVCKISGPATYHRSIRQLHEYGYIKYVPSYNHYLGSLVWLDAMS